MIRGFHGSLKCICILIQLDNLQMTHSSVICRQLSISCRYYCAELKNISIVDVLRENSQYTKSETPIPTSASKQNLIVVEQWQVVDVFISHFIRSEILCLLNKYWELVCTCSYFLQPRPFLLILLLNVYIFCTPLTKLTPTLGGYVSTLLRQFRN